LLIVTYNLPAYVVSYHLVMFCLPSFLLPHFSSVSIVHILFLLSVCLIGWVHPSFTDIFSSVFPFSRTLFWGILVFFHMPPCLNQTNLFSPESFHLSIFSVLVPYLVLNPFFSVFAIVVI
jgi:hypothetical protein